MHGQRRLVDGIRGFSPTKEKWLSKPAQELPEKVTVHFKTGQTGLLDMKSTRAVHWAGVIERLERANRPVCVEVDDESNVITRVLIPKICKVRALEPDEHGNIRVKLFPSAAIHLLLRSDSGFDAMRAELQNAMDDESELLITDTRDEHEVIDVRKPDTAGGPTDPGPSPVDPPVSEERAHEVFDLVNAQSCAPCDPGAGCIPFLYPDSGCDARAHKMCYLMDKDGETPGKVWIGGADVPDMVIDTPNHPDCRVEWSYHVAPTLTLDTPGNATVVIDPSLSAGPESVADWQSRLGVPDATPHPTTWDVYEATGGTASEEQVDADLEEYRDALRDRCEDIGPPPYSCTRGCFFIIDRSTFSNYEVEAMLDGSSPAVIESAFYIVVDGFSPYDLGFATPTMERTPTLTMSPAMTGMTITPARLEFEYPLQLNRRQRLTWVYDVCFADASDFTSEPVTVTLQASMATVSGSGQLYLIQQPNPYEIDGETSWLSTDLRAFQIAAGQSKLGVAMGSDPCAFIAQIINNLNSGDTGEETFENDISVDQQTSRLELSSTVGGTPVYNFAVAKVRYRALDVSATDVRVFFRLFPVATTSLEYDQATSYRRHTAGGTVIPLLGIKNNEVAAVPCFASPRVDTAVSSMTAQTDAPNVQTIPHDASGAEVVRYFGCWLDINQTQVHFPIEPTPVDGPYTSDRKSIQELIRNEHQCVVSEIVFAPAPAENGSTPGVSDKLAQRNLTIVESANPGLVFSRRIPQTFEIRPSASRQEHDELMVDWGNVPPGSTATFYLPGIAASDIRLLAARKYRAHRLVQIDEHTLRCDTGGITYLPIPFADGNFPGLLTVDLPEGVEKGQVFKVVVRQVTSGPQLVNKAPVGADRPGVKHVVGSFQLTIPVRAKVDILPGQQRLLSNLRWIERAIPSRNRWSPVFGKYVAQVADRVDALGGDSNKVAPSASGQWKEAYRNCLLFGLLTVLLIAVLLVGSGTQTGGVVAVGGAPVVALLAGAVYLWRKKCRPTICQLLRATLIGSAVGALVLTVLLLSGQAAPRLVAALLVAAVLTAATAIASWYIRRAGCFRQ